MADMTGAQAPQGGQTAPVASGQADGHVVPLPGTDWAVWRDAVLRTAGFPAAGLDRFTAPGCAAVADAYLDGRASEEELAAALAAALAEASRAASDIAADPLFREAVTWQNPNALHALSIAGHPVPADESGRRRHKRRAREDLIAMYWQRYCGKNDTIGFFGPVNWARVDPAEPGVRVRCGDGLLRSRQTCYEFWVLEAYAASLAADPVVRPWLPAGMHPDLSLDGRWVVRPSGPPLELTDAEVDLLSRCDGRTPAVIVAAHRAADLALLAGLAERDVVWWGIDMPYNSEAERVLRATLEAIPDVAAKERALSGLGRLDAARDAVAAAAGHPDDLAEAIGKLDGAFTAVTGVAPERRQGQMYAGRRVCYEDAVRDLDVTFGKPVLDALAGPLGRVLLPMARWTCASVADAYDAAFRSLFAQLLPPRQARVPLSRYWDAAQHLFTGGATPVDAVAAELADRWNAVLGLDRLPAGTRAVTAASAELAERVAALFPALRPRWPAARIHSPDLHLCAPDEAALSRGDFTIVLGELHAGWPTLDCAVFTDRHPDPASLRAAAAADIGRQFRPLYPTWWPRYTGRIAPNLGVTDYQLAFAHAPGADPARVLPITGLTVAQRDGTLIAEARDGRSWPLLDVFALLVGWSGLEALKRLSSGPHSPRITVDRLVIARETWRTTAGAWPVADGGRQEEYLAARRARRALGLPEKLFAKLSTQIKPVYLDLTSPRYVSAFATMVRSAREEGGDEAGIVLTEMLPGVADAWVPDARGQRYFSELRIQLRDPLTAAGTEAGAA